MHAKLEPERELKFACSDSDVRVALRKKEVKQQQDWRFVFVQRPETFHKDLLSRSICVAVCLPEIGPRGASAKCSDWASELGA